MCGELQCYSQVSSKQAEVVYVERLGHSKHQRSLATLKDEDLNGLHTDYDSRDTTLRKGKDVTY